VAELDKLEETLADVATSVGPSVVRIGRGHGRGAGVVVAGGRVLTNAHNLRGTTTTVTFADGRSVTGTVLGADLDGDLALLDVGDGAPSPVAWEAEEEAPGLGKAVFTVTLVGDLGVRVTAGYVSSVDRVFRGPRGRRIRGGFEHTAPLGPGSSGGPVVDAAGRLLGVDTHRLDGGFYLAVAADADLAERIERLARGEAPRRARLGVGVAPSWAARKMRGAVGLPERDGVLVRVVETGSPAAAADIRQGDLLVEVGGKAVRTADDLLDALAGVEPGSKLAVSLVRGVEDLVVEVEFAVTEATADAGGSDGEAGGEAGGGAGTES
jgi:S1-C subfamily serine protease